MSTNVGAQLTCEDVQDSLGAYALGILDADEIAAIDEHLAGCQMCRNELARQQAVVGSLAILTPQIEPSAKARAQLLEAAASSRLTVLREPIPIDSKARRSIQEWATPILAAAATLLLIGVGVLSVLLMRSVDERDEAITASRMLSHYVSAGADVVTLSAQPLSDYAAYPWEGSMLTSPGKDPVVVVTGCPESGEYLTYYVWFSRDGERSPAGKLTVGNDGSGWLTLNLDQPFSEFDTIGITVVAHDNERQDVLMAPLENVEIG